MSSLLGSFGVGPSVRSGIMPAHASIAAASSPGSSAHAAPYSHTYAVSTAAAIARLKWRPGGGSEQRWQLASCEGAGAGARAGDVQPHLWDVRRPSIALHSPTGHREVCSGMAFAARPSACRATCCYPRPRSHGSSCMLSLRSIRPIHTYPPVALSWSPLDDIVCVTSSAVVALRNHHATASAVAQAAAMSCHIIAAPAAGPTAVTVAGSARAAGAWLALQWGTASLPAAGGTMSVAGAARWGEAAAEEAVEEGELP